MKKLLTFCCALSFITSLFSQKDTEVEYKGKFELSPAFSLQNVSTLDNYDNDGSFFATLPVRFSYYVSKNLSVGTELVLTYSSGPDETGIIINALLEKNIKTKGNAIPFFTAGYGISNGALPIDRMAVNYNGNSTMGVLNLGGGIKFPINDKIMVKTEMRYQQFNGKMKDYEFVDNVFQEKEMDLKIENLSFSIGLCLLL